jgi:gamma-tubulin complex component 5
LLNSFIYLQNIANLRRPLVKSRNQRNGPVQDYEKTEAAVHRFKMAPSTPMTSTQEQLLQSLLPKSITAGKSRKYRDAFNRRVKHHNYARTNQFEVTERLDGLEEKFQILNRDDLSDALRSRRAEIQKQDSGSRFLPDVLDLLLRLSVDPTNIKRSDRLISVKEKPRELPPLRWRDIEMDDPINHQDPIWQDPEYSDLSSDEDAIAKSSIVTSPRSDKSLKENSKKEVLEQTDNISGDRSSPKLLNLSIYRNVGTGKHDASVELGEVQASRECLFMLQGLPTNLYSGDNTSYTANTRYSLNNVNQEAFEEVLRSFGRIGKRVEFVRGWLSEPRTTQYTRTLQHSVEGFVSRFDASIGEMQKRFLQPSGLVHGGLLPCLEAATQYFQKMQLLWEYLQNCESKRADSIGQLEVLFDLICSEQASGRRTQASRLLEVFVPAFKEYLKPLVYWMKYGELHEKLDAFFVKSNGEQKDLKYLWDGWFLLDESGGEKRAPRFLEQFSQPIFALGKTTLFLRRLEGQSSGNLLDTSHLVNYDKLSEVLASSYLSFAESFTKAFESAITPALSQTSNVLYQRLDTQCGLWTVLDSFSQLYFASHGPLTSLVENPLFRRLDKCSPSWSDRFLLHDAYSHAFQGYPDPTRLQISTSHTSSRLLPSRRKSVKILADISLTYTLPWPIANILPASSLQSYRRISLLLMQIRRARDALERRAYFPVMNPSNLISTAAEQLVSRALFQKLLLFNNTLYSHLTSLVIESSTSAMKTRMRQAGSVDEMTRVHMEYVKGLEKKCLTAERLGPIREAVLVVLDLGVRFADIVMTPPGAKGEHSGEEDDDDGNSFRSAKSKVGRRRRNDSEDEDEEDEGDEGYSTFVVLDERGPEEEFRRMGREFERQLAFIVAGLKSLGRVDGEESWGVLAGGLDWKRRAEFG